MRLGGIEVVAPDRPNDDTAQTRPGSPAFGERLDAGRRIVCHTFSCCFLLLLSHPQPTIIKLVPVPGSSDLRNVSAIGLKGVTTNDYFAVSNWTALAFSIQGSMSSKILPGVPS